MILQIFCLYLALICGGVFLCLCAITDPHEVPNPDRQNLFPVGLAMLFLVPGSLLSAAAFGSIGRILDSSIGIEVIAGLGVLAGLVLGAVGGAAAGFALGLARSRRAGCGAQTSRTFFASFFPFLARSYGRYVVSRHDAGIKPRR